MSEFLFLLSAAVAALVFLAPLFVRTQVRISWAVSGTAALLILALGVFATSIVVISPLETGIIVKRFGAQLPEGKIIAANHERGPQAEILGPGVHAGYWPFIYSVNSVRLFTVSPGNVGVVFAYDGQTLPEGHTFAPPWSNPQDMLDAKTFLSGQGYRGPQTTILPPGTYRYNTVLYRILEQNALQVNAGSVVVIKSNTGKIPTSDDASRTSVVNGVPLVPKEYRGIWADPLLPGTYYLNTDAYTPITVRTTQRSYSYSASVLRRSAERTWPVPVPPGGAGRDFGLSPVMVIGGRRTGVQFAGNVYVRPLHSSGGSFRPS